MNSYIIWDGEHQIRTGSNQPNQRLDIVLRPPRAGGSPRCRILPIFAGELKLPCYSLGSGFTAEKLTRRMQDPDYHDDAELNPLYQALSYAIYSQNGVGFLSNFGKNRYFKVNIRSKVIWMSDFVKVDLRLDESSEMPHALQALLHTSNMEDSGNKEFSAALVKGPQCVLTLNRRGWRSIYRLHLSYCLCRDQLHNVGGHDHGTVGVRLIPDGATLWQDILLAPIAKT